MVEQTQFFNGEHTAEYDILIDGKLMLNITFEDDTLTTEKALEIINDVLATEGRKPLSEKMLPRITIQRSDLEDEE